MPIGDYAKDEIREIAKKLNLPVALKKDSQDICFVPNHNYAEFVEKEMKKKSVTGNFVDEEGNVLGTHRGLIHYTIGQRKGLGIVSATPLYVKELKADSNEVVLCRSESLFSSSCYISNVNYMSVDCITKPTRAYGKIRYSHKMAPCTIEPIGEGWLKCDFDDAQRAITPGQAAVFYQDDHILCGGIIEKLKC